VLTKWVKGATLAGVDRVHNLFIFLDKTVGFQPTP